jgi:hypothetical protein
LIDLMKRNMLQNTYQQQQPKKQLILKFIKGPLETDVVLDPEDMPIVFGCSDSNQEAGQKLKCVEMTGPKIVSQHFEIDYDKTRGTIVMRNLNLKTKQSCGLYRMLFDGECYNL